MAQELIHQTCLVRSKGACSGEALRTTGNPLMMLLRRPQHDFAFHAKGAEDNQDLKVGKLNVNHLACQPSPCSHPGQTRPPDLQSGCLRQTTNPPKAALTAPQHLWLLRVFESKPREAFLEARCGFPKEHLQQVL